MKTTLTIVFCGLALGAVAIGLMSHSTDRGVCSFFDMSFGALIMLWQLKETERENRDR